MTEARRERIEELLDLALSLDPPEQESFVRNACGDDESLCDEVLSLLRADASYASAIVSTIRDQAEDLASDRRREMVGQTVSAFRLTEVLGHGGMGTVYLAVHEREGFQRFVALKLIKRGMDTEAIVDRFRRERRILANLDHPYIARFIDGGSTEDGRPFFVMEYVKGQPLIEYCEARKLTRDQRLRLFQSICEAVQHAHRNLVVHRDLKPGNILITGEGIPKLLDFGLARVLNEDGGAAATQATTRMLTPDYASPEQVRGETVSTASDVYSLGAILYELLSAHRPHEFANRSTTTLEYVICKKDPRRPSVHDPALRGDLDNIILKALQKEPEARYATAEQLSGDIQRYLDGVPIIARKDTLVYRASKFVQRHRWPVALASAAVIALLIATTVAIVQARRAELRYERVRALSNVLLYDLGDRIRFLPGSLETRELMLKTGLQYLEELASETGTDNTLLVDLARAYERMASIQGSPDPGDPDLGQPALALQTYRKALSLCDRLPERAGKIPGIAFIRSRIHLAIGGLAADPSEARQHLEASLRWNADLDGRIVPVVWPRDLPSVIQLQRQQAKALLSLIETMEGNPQEGLRLARESGALFSAFCYLTAYNYAGDLQAAIASAEAGREQAGRRIAGSIREDIWKRALRLSRARLSRYAGNQLGNPYFMNVGNTNAAREAYLTGLASVEEVLLRDPEDKEALSARAVIFSGLGATAPDAKTSIDYYMRAMEVKQDFPMSIRPTYGSVGDARWQISYPLRKLGRKQEAVEYAREAVRQNGTVAAHNALGDALLDLGNTVDALSEYRQSMEASEKVVTTKPHDMIARADLAGCYRRLAGLYEARRNAESASSWYTKELEIWKSWTQYGVSSPFNEKRLAEAARLLARSGHL